MVSVNAIILEDEWYSHTDTYGGSFQSLANRFPKSSQPSLHSMACVDKSKLFMYN